MSPKNKEIERRIFKGRNRKLEVKLAQLSQIEADHNVLEVGFGPGIGLKEAYKYIKDGKGKIYGIDISDVMVKEASGYLKQEIESGKVDVQLGDVMHLPYSNDVFDRVFHCNCYYFWTDMKGATDELYRVMGDNSRIITAMNEYFVNKVVSLGFMRYGNIDRDRYMDSLKLSGFQNVELKTITSTTGVKLIVIVGEIHNKTK